MRCSVCGEEMEDGARFCSTCGSAAEDSASALGVSPAQADPVRGRGRFSITAKAAPTLVGAFFAILVAAATAYAAFRIVKDVVIPAVEQMVVQEVGDPEDQKPEADSAALENKKAHEKYEQALEEMRSLISEGKYADKAVKEGDEGSEGGMTVYQLNYDYYQLESERDESTSENGFADAQKHPADISHAFGLDEEVTWFEYAISADPKVKDATGYIFTDLDGDGVDEMVIGVGNTIAAIAMVHDDDLYVDRASFANRGYERLCEDGGFVAVDNSNAYSYVVHSRYELGEIVEERSLDLEFDENAGTVKVVISERGAEDIVYDSVSLEEAYQMRDEFEKSCKPLEKIDWKPAGFVDKNYVDKGYAGSIR